VQLCRRHRQKAGTSKSTQGKKHETLSKNLKSTKAGQCLQLMSVIPATQEAEIRSIVVQKPNPVK
jgi:hypothetical protein